MPRIIAIFVSFLLLVYKGVAQTSSPLFELMPPEKISIQFKNTVNERPGLNVLEAEYFYNGGGVSIGDINNDGLPDIYLSANMGTNALYLNKGDFRFANIAQEAGVTDSDGWSSGVTMADVNGDGFLDIYVCKTGKGNEDGRRNKLFINNGDLTFTERASEYGLDDRGYSTHAVFFDYDRDGDLDVFLVNYSVKRYQNFDIITIRKRRDPYAGDRLLVNENGHFTDISREAGIIQNPIGFGLSATASDINMDGWPDIYVANDYMEKDYLYINQQDGTFREEVASRTTHISYFSMGTDIADFNNDTYPDILTADMLPDEIQRRKMFKTPDYSIYHRLAYHGYHRQNMRNMLQMNRGDGTFTEIGQLAGISRTDWSWAVLMADFDNDGLKDVYITNGFPRDYTNLDYLNEVLWKHYPEEEYRNNPEKLYELVKQMPAVKLHNYAFKNRGELTFTPSEDAWGLNQYAVSNGAAYGDLDNDGDLDLVVNNINENAFVFKNKAREQNSNHYLKVQLAGKGENRFGVGAKVTLSGRNGATYFQEAFPARGYQSSVEPVLLFGLGQQEQVDIKVEWNDGSVQLLNDINVNQTITINQRDAEKLTENNDDSSQGKSFSLLDKDKMGLAFTHKEIPSKDLNRQPLMPHTLSNLSPALASGDVNNDGLEDLFIGGGKGQSAKLLLQQKSGTYSEAESPFFELHKEYEDTDALFFDADGNGSLDLYVVSGGNFDPLNGSAYQDRLYMNDGFGRFTYYSETMPSIESSGKTVEAADFDQDGDPDLFVGGRVLTGKYPFAPRSYLLQNNSGRFKDITKSFAPALLRPGMVSDAVWADINQDSYPDLIIAGEWMPIRIFQNNKGKTFSEITEAAGMEKTSGWWNVLKIADINLDGNIDIIAGNRGLNAALTAPADLYAGDFDGNDTIDPLITQVINDRKYPVANRDQLIRQMPGMAEKFPDYASYSTATVEDILTEDQVREASRFVTHTFASTVFKNNGDNTFDAIPLPPQAQAYPIFDMFVGDVNRDDIPDILTVGNNFGTQPELGPLAGQGDLLIGDGAFGFIVKEYSETGFRAPGDVRDLEVLYSRIGPVILLGRNGDTVIPYLYRNTDPSASAN